MNLIPIGRFSQMTRLSVKALRHYDEKGVLKPAHIDTATRYRYYAASQTKQAAIVRTLRSVDMPIEDIKLVLAQNDVEIVQQQLEQHRKRLTANVAVQQRMLAYLETIIHRKEIVVSYEIAIENTESQYVASVMIRTDLTRIGAEIQSGFGRLVGGLMQADVQPTGAPMLVYHDVIDAETEGDIEICAPVDPAFEGSETVSVRTLEATQMAATVHKGAYESIGPAYEAITAWLAEHDYEVVGPPREVYLNDPQQVSAEELLTWVGFPCG